MDRMPDPLAVLNDLRESPLLRELHVAALDVAALGHEYHLLARHFAQHAADQHLRGAVHVVSASVDQVPAAFEIQREGLGMRGVAVRNAITAEPERVAGESGCAQGTIRVHPGKYPSKSSRSARAT